MKKHLKEIAKRLTTIKYFSQYIILFGLCIIPICNVSIFRDSATISRMLLLIVINIALFIFTTITIVKEKRVYIRHSSIIYTALIFVLLYFLFSFTSVYITGSFFLEHAEYFSLNFLILFELFIWFWFIIYHTHKISQWKKGLSALLLGTSLVSAILLISNIFAIDNLWVQDIVSYKDFGILFILMSLMSFGFFGKRGLERKQYIYLFFIGILLLSSSIFIFHELFLLPLFIIGLLCFFVFGLLMQKHIQTYAFSIWGVILVFALAVFILFPSISTNNLENKTLSFSSTKTIITQIFSHNTFRSFIGYGQGNFFTAYSELRTLDMNIGVDVLKRYTQSSSTYFNIFFEQGIIGVGMFTIFCVFILSIFFGSARHIIKNSSLHGAKKYLHIGTKKIEYETIILGIVWMILTLYFFVAVVGILLWWLWWTVLAFLLIGLYTVFPSLIKEKSYSLHFNSEYAFIKVFVFILITFGGGVFLVYFSKSIYSEILFTKAIQKNDIHESIEYTHKAIGYNKNPEYYRVQAKQYLQLTRNESIKEAPNTQDIIVYLGKALEMAKKSTEFGKHDIKNWEMLATIYLNSRPVVSEGANDWVIASLQKASELEPSNPFYYWRLADAYLYEENSGGAQKAYREAIRLKPDYIRAYIDYSEYFARNEEFEKAVYVFEPIFENIQDNPDVLYTLGAYVFNRNFEYDKEEAKKMWERVLVLEPGHANTLFALGIYYNDMDKKNEAQEYFKRANDIDPDNEEIKKYLLSI
jgi:hypothetical protein